MIKILLLSLLLSINSYAASLDIVPQVGIGKNVIAHEPFERFFDLGLRYGAEWKAQINGGYWLALAPNEKASWFLSAQGGVEVVSQTGLMALLMIGPAYVRNLDHKTCSHFQFHIFFGAGIKSESGIGIMGGWTHFSNAGLKAPNNGRDLITLVLTVPLYKTKS